MDDQQSGKKKRRSPCTNTNTVDTALKKLSEAEIEEFKREIVRYPRRPDFEAMVRWFAEKGLTVSKSAMLRWYKKSYPTGQEAKILNGIFAEHQNMDPEVALGGTVGILAANVAAVSNLLKTLNTEQLEVKSVTQYLYALNTQGAAIAKLADIADRLQQTQTIRTKREYTLAGAAQLAAIVTEELKDTPAEAAVRLAIQAAIARMEEEAIK